MNSKKLKKIIKRRTAKFRALRQTARRRTQLSTNKNQEQMAQDIYSREKAVAGKAGDNQKGGEYAIKKYDYNMFEYGDPYAIKLKSSATTSMNKRQKNTWNQAKRDQTSKTKSASRGHSTQKAARGLSTLS